MENQVNVKGVSLKELFTSFFWKSDSPKKDSEQSSEMDKKWKKVLDNLDKQEMSVRNGGQVSSKIGRENSLKKMQVKNPSKEREQSIRQKEENIDKEREE